MPACVDRPVGRSPNYDPNQGQPELSTRPIRTRKPFLLRARASFKSFDLIGCVGSLAHHGAGSHEMAFVHQRLLSVHQPGYRSLRRNASAASATSTAASRSDVSTGQRTATSFPAASEEGTVARAAGEYVPRGFQIAAIATSA